jgi:hypothetical protein
LNLTNLKSINVYELELKLTDLDPLLFTDRDETYRNWCWQVVDKTVPFPYKLGSQLGPKDDAHDKHLVFELEGDPEKVIVFGPNQSLPKIEELRCKRYLPSKHLPLIWTDFDKEGRYIVMQKLSNSITETIWKSADYPDQSELTSDDKQKVDAIVSMLRGFRLSKQSPSKLDPKSIYFDREGKLKSLKPYTIEKLDFQGLIDCARASARGNEKVLRAILNKTGFASDPIGHYYFTIVKQAISGDKISAEDEAALTRIDNNERLTDPKVIKRARNLSQEILDMRARCAARIREDSRSSQMSREEIIINLNRIIPQLYQEHGLVSHIGTKLEDLIIDEFLKYCL